MYPMSPDGELKGIKICNQANGFWKEEFQKRQDPMGRDYYWLTGFFHNREPEGDGVGTDEWALEQHYASVVPINTDLTAYTLMDKMAHWEKTPVRMAKNKRFDSMALGLIAGLLLPLVTLMIFWLVRDEGGLGEFLTYFQRIGALSKIISLSVIPNLLLFFLFIWTNRTFSARGVIFATLLVAMVMLVLKFA